MARNVEIKARLRNPLATRSAALALATAEPELLVQRDTFYAVPRGRLKLRWLQNRPAELIFYQRPDASGPKVSHYEIFRTADPEGLHTTLAAALGVLGELRKQRTLVMVGRTRVHLDEVEGLGDYLELEVVLGDDEAIEHGVAEAQDLMQQLGVVADDLVEGAYLDLLLARAPGDRAAR